jgi:hypothetical protein
MTCKNGEDDVFFELMAMARSFFNRSELPNDPQDYTTYHVFRERSEFQGKNLLQAVNTIRGIYERIHEILQVDLEAELSSTVQTQKFQRMIRRP